MGSNGDGSGGVQGDDSRYGWTMHALGAAVALDQASRLGEQLEFGVMSYLVRSTLDLASTRGVHGFVWIMIISI